MRRVRVPWANVVLMSQNVKYICTIIVSNLTVIKVTLRMMIVIGGADTLLTMLSHGGHLLYSYILYAV